MPTRVTVTHAEIPSDNRLIIPPVPTSNLHPEMFVAKKVHVLRIPPTGSPPIPMSLDTTEIKESRTYDEETKKNEGWLKHVPDIQNCKAAAFHWDSRSLVAVNMKNSDKVSHQGWWLMYKCDKPKDGMPTDKNPYFRGDQNANAFGDVFVFKLEADVFDRSGRAKYATQWPVPDKDFERKLFLLMATM